MRLLIVERRDFDSHGGCSFELFERRNSDSLREHDSKLLKGYNPELIGGRDPELFNLLEG